MSGNNRPKKKEKENECPRFKQHNKKTTVESDEKLRKDQKNKQGIKVFAASSNLSRNVASNVNSPNEILIKRTGAAVSTTSTSSTPPTGPKCVKVGTNKQSDLEGQSLKPNSFEPGPPPAANSLHRLSRKVSNVKSELDQIDSNSTEEGIRLAEEKLEASPTSKKNFQKSVSKQVDVSPEEQLYSSLANISLSSTSFDSRLDGAHNFWVASESRKGRDPEPKLEWFHQPYKGTEVLVHASNDIYQMMLEETFKYDREKLLSTPSRSDYNMYDD